MTRSIFKACQTRRMAVFCFFALSVLLVVSSSRPWATAQAGWRVEIKEGETASSSLQPRLKDNGTLQPEALAADSYTLNKYIYPGSTAIVPPTAATVFTKNQRLLTNHSPAAILPTDDTGISFTGTIPVGSPVHIVYGISVPTGDPNPVSLTITLPTTFTPTLLRSMNFPGGTGSGSLLPPAVTSLPTFSIGALSGNFDKVIVVIDGFFTQAGSVFATFAATRNATTESTSLTMNADVLNLPVDISVTKVVQPKTGGTWGSTATVPFGGTVTYKLTIKNESVPDPNHSTDVYLGPLLKLQDTLSTPNTNDVNLSITASNFQCTASGLTDCPTMPAPMVMTLGANSSQALTLAYPGSSNGFLPAQGSFEITFDAVISTSAACSPGQNNKLLNMGFFTYSNGTKTVSDQVPSNNSTLPLSPTTVTLTGLPATGCITDIKPGIKVEKKLVSPGTGAWGVPFTYLITITNNSGQPLTGLRLWDYVSGNSTPPFTATISPTASNFICSPACGFIPPAAASLVLPSTPYVFQSLDLASPMAIGAVQTVQFDVQYDTPCAESTAGGSITNNTFLTGPATGSASVLTSMPALPLCQLAATKVQTSGPTSFASFPVTLGYKVEFKNTSNQIIRVGTLIDALALDSSAYGNVPVDYSYTCTASGVTNISPLNKATTSALIQNNNPLWAGVRLIDFSSAAGAVFSPLGNVSCNVSVTLKQPPTNDSHCQGAGTPKIVNSAFMDLAFGFNTNQAQQPVYYQNVTTPLPKCVSIIVGKTVAPNVFAGGAVTFTLTAKNVANDPVSNITLNDNVPLDFTNVMWTCASGCSGSGSSTPSNTISIPLNPIAAGATVTVVVTATAPTILGSYCNSANATFNPFPALSFFEGDQNALTTASACVQVKSPEPTKPTLTKSFESSTIGPNGTTTLAFTITNSSGDPKQTGIAFSDTLPPGLQIVSVVSSGCSGTVTISPDHQTVTLTGGQLIGSNADGSGQHSCKIVVKLKATDQCGLYPNNEKNFSDVKNLDTSGINAQLTVGDCGGSGLTIEKKVPGAPPGFKGQFNFLVQCATPKGFYQKAVTVDWPTPGFITLTDVPAGSQCTVTEGPPPASLPASYNWSGLPAYLPQGGVVDIGPKGGHVTVTDTLSACNEKGQVTITKVVQGLPKDYIGVFEGTLQCWVSDKLVTYPVTLTSPNGLSATIGNIPLGSACTFQETVQPPLKGDLKWNQPVYSPNFGTVTLSGECCQQITVTNEAHHCCSQPESPGPGTGKSYPDLGPVQSPANYGSPPKSAPTGRTDTRKAKP